MMHRLACLGGWSDRYGLRVVLYHHIAEQEDDLTRGLGVTLAPDVFAMHLDHYERDYNVVDLDAVLAGDLPERPLLITFDDAYRSVVDVAMPILAERGLPAVLFASTTPLDNRQLLLDNLLCWIVNTQGLCALLDAISKCTTRESVGEIITHEIAAMQLDAREALRHKLITQFEINERSLLKTRPYLAAADLQTLVEHGFEIGCHTADHVHGRQIALGDVRSQLLEPLELLCELTDCPCRAFSYPYGERADATELVEGVIRSSGCAATFLVEGRTNDSVDLHDPLYRVSPKARDPKRLSTELEVLPRFRAVRDRLGLQRRAA